MIRFKMFSRAHLAAYVTYSLAAYLVISDIFLYFDLLTDGEQNALVKKEISVKKLMVGPLSYYVRTPLAFFLENYFGLSTNLPWLTANVISCVHVVLSLVSVRFLADETLEWRQLGCVVFHVRNFLDSLDGIIYRAQARQPTFKSNYGSFGYFVDTVSDTLGGICLGLGVLIYLYRRRPLILISSRVHLGWFNTTVLDALDRRILPHESAASVPPSPTNGGYSLVEMHDVETNGKTNKRPSNGFVPASRMYIIVASAFLGLRLAVSGFFWDRSVQIYSDLLETDTFLGTNLTQTQKQIQAAYLSSSLTLFIMFAWRIVSAISLLDIILSAIFLDKIWEFMEKTKIFYWIILFGLVSITELHALQISSNLYGSN